MLDRMCNLVCERDLPHFSKHTEVAEFCNKNFQTKEIREYCTLHHTTTSEPDQLSRKVRDMLKLKEKMWTEKQQNAYIIYCKA